ncbi:hypothetical protein FRC07_001012, partial [Ceratobasidium sp. 392]
MDISLEYSDPNDITVEPTLRGPPTPAVVQASRQAVDRPTLQYISQAIKSGDNLPNRPASLEAEVLRRALIVAPQYQVHFDNFGHLPATLNDVCRVHKMLIHRGYDPANIRILVDGLRTDPTSDNIIDSLEWLVSNVQPGDYRFFHFSGHGTHILSTREKGKETLKIPTKRSDSLPFDHELNPSSNHAVQYKRIESLNVHQKDVTYYNEAIVTSYKPLPLLDSLTEDVTEYNMIRDSVLNEYFARLPEKCRLTCTLDRKNDDAQGHTPEEPSKTVTRMDDLVEQLSQQTIRDLSPSGSNTTTSNTSTMAEDVSSSSDASTTQNSPVYRGKTTQNQATAKPPGPSFVSQLVQNFTSPPLVSNITELLPAEEANRDKIKADMLTWSGCHQRQGAVDYSDLRGGLFTRVGAIMKFTVIHSLTIDNHLHMQSFTETVMSNGSSATVRELYDKINDRIAGEARDFHGGVLQYAQVWTSCREGKEEQAKSDIFYLDMDVSLEPSVNPVFRGPPLQTVAQAPSAPQVPQAPQAVDSRTLQYIFQATEDGDNLPNSATALEAAVLRRALIIAPQYLPSPHQVDYDWHLPATLNDVYRVYRMLMKYGYDPANVRILVDGLHSHTAPTRDNIIESLKWLVSNAQPGDYRFFHFSGHGIPIPSTKDQGKETIKMPESKRSDSAPPDYPFSNHHAPYTQVRSMSVDPQHITYHNEAILTSYKLPLLDSQAKVFKEYNLIRDTVLNEYFAKLPEQCKLTCTLDCCHSGRMTRAGFRGKPIHANAQSHAPEESIGTLISVDSLSEQLGKQTIEDSLPSGGYPVISSAWASVEDVSSAPDAPNSSQNRGVISHRIQATANLHSPGFLSQLFQFFAPPPPSPSPPPPLSSTLPDVPRKVILTELLPAAESGRDKIKADMLTWSGCHQLQKAIDWGDKRGGLFTR